MTLTLRFANVKLVLRPIDWQLDNYKQKSLVIEQSREGRKILRNLLLLF
jgi:hypothetical protein